MSSRSEPRTPEAVSSLEGFGNEEARIWKRSLRREVSAPTPTIESTESTLAVASRWIREAIRKRIPGTTSRGGTRVDWNLSPQDSLTVQGDVYRGRMNQTTRPYIFFPPYTQEVTSQTPVSGGNVLDPLEPFHLEAI